ncbi:MAG: hypothetical protein ACUVQG_14815 [Thermogutta sp.]
MRTRAGVTIVFGCFLVSILFLGCKTRNRGNIPQTAPVSGIVTLDGKPVDGANVVFVPTSTPGYGAYGIADSSGRFVLKSSEAVTGAVPGKYLVQVTKLVPDTGGRQSVVAEDAEHEAEAAGGSPAGSVAGTKNVLPEKYANPKTSGIEVVVPSEGLQNLEIKLTSQ